MEQHLYEGISKDLHILTAVHRTQKPEIALVIDLLQSRRPRLKSTASRDLGTKKAAAAILDKCPHLLHRFRTKEMFDIVFLSILIDTVHKCNR